jgi:hypothetical protein
MFRKSYCLPVICILLLPAFLYAQKSIFTVGVGYDGLTGEGKKDLKLALNANTNLFWIPNKHFAIGGMAAYHYWSVEDFEIVGGGMYEYTRPTTVSNHIIEIEPLCRILLNPTPQIGMFIQAGLWGGILIDKEIQPGFGIFSLGCGFSIYNFEIVPVIRALGLGDDGIFWSINVGYNFNKKKEPDPHQEITE